MKYSTKSYFFIFSQKTILVTLIVTKKIVYVGVKVDGAKSAEYSIALYNSILRTRAKVTGARAV